MRSQCDSHIVPRARMSCCVAYKCSQRQVPSSELSFFRFPLSDKDRLQKWIHNVKRKSWTPKKHSRLCSLHFTQDCILPVQGRNMLKPDAVPTVFYPHCQLTATGGRTRVSRNTALHETDDSKHRTFSHDHDYTSATHSEAQSAETSVASASASHSADHGAYTRRTPARPQGSCPYKKELKLQAQRVRRLKQKVKSLSSAVTDLRQKMLVSTSCARSTHQGDVNARSRSKRLGDVSARSRSKRLGDVSARSRATPLGDVSARSRATPLGDVTHDDHLSETPIDMLQILLQCCDGIYVLPASGSGSAAHPGRQKKGRSPCHPSPNQ